MMTKCPEVVLVMGMGDEGVGGTGQCRGYQRTESEWTLKKY